MKPLRASDHVSEKDYVDHAQYATYFSDNSNEATWNNVEGLSLSPYYFDIYTKLTFLGNNVKAEAKGWVPLPLQAWFWIPLVAFMILTAFCLEMALYYSNLFDGKSFISGWAFSFIADVA